MTRKTKLNILISILIPGLIITFFCLLSSLEIISIKKINYLLPLFIIISSLIYLKTTKISFSCLGIRTKGFRESLFYSLVLIIIFLLYTLSKKTSVPILSVADLKRAFFFMLPLSVITAFGEEIWVRGVLFCHLEKFKNENFAFLISSIIFAFFHFRHGLASIISALIFGFSFGFVRLKTKNILGLIFSHSLYNFLYVFLLTE